MKNPEALSPNKIQHSHQTDPQHSKESEKLSSYSCSQNKTELQEALHEQLKKLGFSKNGKGYLIEGQLTKQRIRDFHSKKRIDILRSNRAFIEQFGPDLVMNFANGRQVDPEAISPELIEVRPESEESRLFRFASLLWSVPVSQGFGRRIRFLVRDKQNGQLIGLFALGDPVFNLSARDKWIGWTFEDRKDRLKHIMDAYVVGSVPPYSQLIGGKLVAALMGSKEVQEVYDRKYLGREAVISGKKNRARLVLLTTTSALGRSSLYNRLAIPNGPQFIRIGETRGFGHFHLSGEIFEKMRGYLEAVGHPYATGNRFGMGPNWKFRVARVALEKIGLDGNDILNHGIAREVYAIPLSNNWQEILQGTQKNVFSCVLPASEIMEFCLNRWIIPRASRDKRYMYFERCRIMECLLNGGPGPSW
ncbi:MAG: Druantia anti-phage system protein DruA [bacterium]